MPAPTPPAVAVSAGGNGSNGMHDGNGGGGGVPTSPGDWQILTTADNQQVYHKYA